MRKVGAIVVALAVTAGLAFAAAPAGAGVAEKSTKKFCNAVSNAFDDISAGAASGIDEESAGNVAKALRKAAKSAPSKKIKKAMKKLAGFYNRIADGESLGDVFIDAGYARAAATFTTAYLKSCIGDISIPSIPNVSIPDIPDIG